MPSKLDGTRLRDFCKSPLRIPKTFKALVCNNFLKVLGILKPFLQEGFKWGAGVKPLPYKLQFHPLLMRPA